MEMARHIKPLYVKAHLNGRSVSKVLINNGSTVNAMPLRMLRALGRSICDMIETKVAMFAFTGEVSKTLGMLPIDITIGNRTSLSTFFVIDFIANYNIFLGKDWIHVNWCVCHPLFTNSYCFGKVMKWSWCRQISSLSWRLQAL